MSTSNVSGRYHFLYERGDGSWSIWESFCTCQKILKNQAVLFALYVQGNGPSILLKTAELASVNMI